LLGVLKQALCLQDRKGSFDSAWRDAICLHKRLLARHRSALFRDRWDIRRVHHREIVAVPRHGAGDPLRVMSAAVLRVLIGEAEWRRVTAKHRPARPARPARS